MNAAPLDSQNPASLPPPNEPAWSATRWVISITLVFGLHLGLIYLLSERHPQPPRAVKNAATLTVTAQQTEWQQLHDPTLFALPHPKGFAGESWLRLPQIVFAPFRWTEPPRLLALPAEELGAVFLRLAETNAPPLRQIATAAPPLTTVVAPFENDIPRGPSTVRLNGGFEGRQLRVATPPLPLQPASDSLTNSLVQVLVDARGLVLSATTCPPGSNSKADQDALKIARTLRFNSIADETKLTVGKLIFEWQPDVSSNAVPPKP